MNYLRDFNFLFLSSSISPKVIYEFADISCNLNNKQTKDNIFISND